MGNLIDDIVNTAQAYTENFKTLGNLDYSIESLKLVDEHLDEISDFVFSEDDVYNAASMVGCYVFETARRNYGGNYYWIEKEQQPILTAGEPDFAVSIKAWDKVKERLNNGEEDDIVFYINGYKEHIEIGRNKKGYHALII